MPQEAELTQQQTLLGVLALRSLLERASEFIWHWQRPEDFKDILSAETLGLRIELINYKAAGKGLLFLRYGGDTCGAISTETAPEHGREMFFDLWEKTLLICKQQRDEAIRRAFLLEQKGNDRFQIHVRRKPAEGGLTTQISTAGCPTLSLIGGLAHPFRAKN